MTADIAAVLTILVLALVLFVSERLRMDLIALLVLITLAVTRLVTPDQAVSGFSSPAVITVWAVFILSAGLERTGVAQEVGHHVLRLSGREEWRLVLVIMLAAGLMSAFMNNVGVAALLLPVVMDISRRTGHAPSRLLMPLAFGCLLGGLTTLIGTPPNILVNSALAAAADTVPSVQPFGFFDFSRAGVVVALTAILFVALIGRRMLPHRDVAMGSALSRKAELTELYELKDRLHVIRVPASSPLTGKNLAESRLGAALGVNVIAVLREEAPELAPGPDTILEAGDRLLVEGRAEELTGLHGPRDVLLEAPGADVASLLSQGVGAAEVRVADDSPLVDRSLRQTGFRNRYGVIVLALWRSGEPKRTIFHDDPLHEGDNLLVQGPEERLAELKDSRDFSSFRSVPVSDVAEGYRIQERLTALRIPDSSALTGQSLADSRLGDAFGIAVLGIIRDGVTNLMPDPSETLAAGDTLIVKCRPESLLALRGLHSLELDPADRPELDNLETEAVGLSEVVLSPHTTLIGNTLREMHFREKYGLSVLAIWRQGRAYRTGLRDKPLKFGDALLLYGPRERLRVLGPEPDFLVLTEAAQAAPLRKKAPVAALVMAAVLIPVIFGWLPIAITALIGAVLMVLTKCLTMEQAHRAIQWPVVFLIAGMLPLGIALQETGAASFLADGMVGALGGFGPLAILAGLFVLTTVTSQVMPNAAVAVLLAPIALSTAATIDVSPYPLLMGVAIAASASFLSPVGHPANVLVMGPGGYRFTDFIRVGLPVTLVVAIVSLLVLPIVWPF